MTCNDNNDDDDDIDDDIDDDDIHNLIPKLVIVVLGVHYGPLNSN